METVNDITKEMRDWDFHSHLDGGGHAELSSYADRLDAAYKSDLQAMTDAGEIDMKTAMDEVTRLRDALKPVLEFDALFGDLDEFDCCECKFCQVGDSDCWRGKAMRMRSVIQNARRIYNGGAE